MDHEGESRERKEVRVWRGLGPSETFQLHSLAKKKQSYLFGQSMITLSMYSIWHMCEHMGGGGVSVLQDFAHPVSLHVSCEKK